MTYLANFLKNAKCYYLNINRINYFKTCKTVNWNVLIIQYLLSCYIIYIISYIKKASPGPLPKYYEKSNTKQVLMFNFT